MAFYDIKKKFDIGICGFSHFCSGSYVNSPVLTGRPMISVFLVSPCLWMLHCSAIFLKFQLKDCYYFLPSSSECPLIVYPVRTRNCSRIPAQIVGLKECVQRFEHSVKFNSSRLSLWCLKLWNKTQDSRSKTFLKVGKCKWSAISACSHKK